MQHTVNVEPMNAFGKPGDQWDYLIEINDRKNIVSIRVRRTGSTLPYKPLQPDSKHWKPAADEYRRRKIAKEAA